MNRTRSVVSTATLAMAAWLGFGFEGISLAQVRNQTAAKPPIADTAFKNVKVLKGIPVDEFMGTMGLFSAALSVCCGD